MKIGILVLSIGNFGKKGFYNLQEVGLAKSLDKFYDQVIIYKLVNKNENEYTEIIDNTNNTCLKVIPSKSIGSNGNVNLKKLDPKLDALICFSDTQIYFPKIYKWCKKNNIKLIPYIGTINSSSKNIIKRLISNYFTNKNINLYKKLDVVVKTKNLKDELLRKNVLNAKIMNVGLDLDLLNKNYKSINKDELKIKYGFNKEDEIILFVGRLEQEKRPIDIINIFNDISKKDNKYKLLIIGKGSLKDKVINKINELNISDKVKIFEQIENKYIYEVYCISKYFVNLCKNEIFGMALLEAMYYETCVIASHANGPDEIINDKVNGYLVNEDKEISDIILNNKYINAHESILNKFTWDKTINELRGIING